MRKEHRIIQTGDNTIIGSNIKRLRKQHNIRQNDFVAELQSLNIDISVFSLCKIENGIQNPTITLLIAITHLLNCDFNDLFKPVEDKNETADI